MARSRRKSGGGGSPNKKLPLNQSIPLGIQHVLAMFAGNITVPIFVYILRIKTNTTITEAAPA